MNPDLFSPENTAEIDALLRAGAQEALATTDFVTAFDAFRRDLPEQAPRLAAMLPPEGERPIAFAMFLEIWNRLPRPDHDWKTLPLPKPERNAPCPCGSGRKFKQCCGAITDISPFGMGELSVLAYVLETLPVAQYKNLPFKKLSPEEIAHVAQHWFEDGRDDAAAALLEAQLAPGGKLDARHEHAFDILCDIYLDMSEPDKRLALVERLMQAPDRELKTAAMLCRCTMLADTNDYAAAWKLFKETQRHDPDNPSLSHLEVVLLASQGEVEKAGERARFWAARLVRQGYPGEELIAWLSKIGNDPKSLLDMMRGGPHLRLNDADDFDDEFTEVDLNDVDTLLALVDALPAPACHYQLSPQDGNAGPLEADPALTAIEAEWRGIFWGDGDEEYDEDQEYPGAGDPWGNTRWIGWLRDNPLAWQSFPVLEDLTGSLEYVLFPEDHEDRCDWLEETLLDHAMALLRTNIASNQAENCTLEWDWQENRPALSLLMRLSEIAYDSEEEVPLLEWLVLTLNPGDNHGFRTRLVHRLCESGRAADALAVCARYPDDSLGGLLYGRVLALALLDRHDDAATALADAKMKSPKLLASLVATNAPQPKLPFDSVTPGSEDEAWLYRTECLRVWQETGAFVWLQQVAGA